MKVNSEYLVEVYYTYRASLRQIIEKRIGLEAFTNKLTQVTKSESYTRAIKKPHINYKQASEVVFDYEFCRLFKSVERKYLLFLLFCLKNFNKHYFMQQ